MMKPILVIIAPRWSIGAAWVRENEPIASVYNWSVASEMRHLYGYHGVKYIDLGSAIPGDVLEMFKATNEKVTLPL